MNLKFNNLNLIKTCPLCSRKLEPNLVFLGGLNQEIESFTCINNDLPLHDSVDYNFEFSVNEIGFNIKYNYNNLLYKLYSSKLITRRSHYSYIENDYINREVMGNGLLINLFGEIEIPSSYDDIISFHKKNYKRSII